MPTRTGLVSAADEPRSAGSLSSDTQDGGRFLPGATLAGRYRVVGLVGRGGMGEVYRADDLKLGQVVALKFLPVGLEDDPRRLERLLNEVKLARQVAHPHVCRVYDVGELDGQHFLSMEYVDGEDLASLLRRIGRLPQDKAIQIARQVCAGLASAHQLGILHRDLKPANVMLDGRGQAKITDFGLASLEEQAGDDAGAGTPAYMAPEQLTGGTVTARSDLYALGLLLYELFTGRRAFDARTLQEMRRLQEESSPTFPSAYVSSLDPATERAILQCLEKEPKNRPPTPLAVAAALPGGDPLQAALAAGETPSPELVAAAGSTEPVPVRQAAAYLLVAVTCTVATIALMSSYAPHKATSLHRSPAVLEDRAKEIIAILDPGHHAVDSAHGFSVVEGLQAELLDTVNDSDELRSRLALDQPSVLEFWYRDSPGPLVPVRHAFFGAYRFAVTPEDPPFSVAGMTQLTLSPQGKLTSYRSLPRVYAEQIENPGAVDWSTLFELAGLDPRRFDRVDPTRTPATPSDQRYEWVGSYPDRPQWKLRIAAAQLGGRPVYFEQIGPWEVLDRQAEDEAVRAANRQRSRRTTVIFILFGMSFTICGLLAWRNVRLGRSDRRGALRLTAVLLLANLLTWLCEAHLSAGLSSLGLGALIALSWAMSRSIMAGVQYLGLEPYIRKHLPHGLISWSRLLAGQWRDPLVGRDVLRGLAAVSVLFLAFRGWGILLYANSLGGRLVWGVQLLTSPIRGTLASLSGSLNSAVAFSLTLIFMLIVLRVVLRRWWPAIGLWLLIDMGLSISQSYLGPGDWPLALLISGTTLLVMLRFGLLSFVTFTFARRASFVPLTLDATAWYAPATYLALTVFVLLCGYGFMTAIGGSRRLMQSASATEAR